MKPAGPIYNVTPFTLLDYPDKVACIVWFAGCNMRCLYCYNPDIVLGKGTISFEKVLQFLKSRTGILDGVVLSGGECTLHKDVIWFIKQVKELGFLIKLDTNGSKPDMIAQLINAGLVDYIALDFKALPNRFEAITGSNLFSHFEQTLTFLIGSAQQFEVRTTVHSDLINETDFKDMMSYLECRKYIGNYYVQHFVNDVPTLSSLGSSYNRLKNTNCSTHNIEVVFR